LKILQKDYIKKYIEESESSLRKMGLAGHRGKIGYGELERHASMGKFRIFFLDCPIGLWWCALLSLHLVHPFGRTFPVLEAGNANNLYPAGGLFSLGQGFGPV
jgi:hypothetical protein